MAAARTNRVTFWTSNSKHCRKHNKELYGKYDLLRYIFFLFCHLFYRTHGSSSQNACLLLPLNITSLKNIATCLFPNANKTYSFFYDIRDTSSQKKFRPAAAERPFAYFLVGNVWDLQIRFDYLHVEDWGRGLKRVSWSFFVVPSTHEMLAKLPLYMGEI